MSQSRAVLITAGSFGNFMRVWFAKNGISEAGERKALCTRGVRGPPNPERSHWGTDWRPRWLPESSTESCQGLVARSVERLWQIWRPPREGSGCFSLSHSLFLSFFLSFLLSFFSCCFLSLVLSFLISLSLFLCFLSLSLSLSRSSYLSLSLVWWGCGMAGGMELHSFWHWIFRYRSLKFGFSAEFEGLSWKIRALKTIFRTLEHGHSIRHQSIPPLSAGRKICQRYC